MFSSHHISAQLARELERDRHAAGDAWRLADALRRAPEQAAPAPAPESLRVPASAPARGDSGSRPVAVNDCESPLRIKRPVYERGVSVRAGEAPRERVGGR